MVAKKSLFNTVATFGQTSIPKQGSRSIRKALIREDLVNLTGDFRAAVVLNQFIYWTQQTGEIQYSAQNGCTCDLIDLKQIWIIKSAQDLSEETMLGLSRQTMRIILRDFIAAGWIEESLLGKYKCYKTAKYRLN